MSIANELKVFLSSAWRAQIVPWCEPRPVAQRIAMCGALLCSCSQQIASAEQPPTVSSEPAAKTLELQGAAAEPGLNAEDIGFDDVELRRGYGAVDMRFADCIRRVDERTLVGDACTPGFLIYGPYVPVPANSEIEVSFEVRASKRVEVYSDVVSQMGTQMLAALNRQVLEAGSNSKLGYRVRVWKADSNIESRIGMAAEAGTRFEVTNLTMTVR